jgi:hypothetical protein
MPMYGLRFKYIERADGYPSELFELAADPGEARNVISEPAYQEQLSGLRWDLAEFFNGATLQLCLSGARRQLRGCRPSARRI